MIGKSDWQEANRELMAEERRRLGDPPTAEELLAYSRGELSEADEERIRDLIVAYPELARMYAEPAPEEPRPGEPDHVSQEQIAAGWNALQQRLRRSSDGGIAPRDEAQRGRMLFHYVPTAVAAVVALVFFGLFVQAERRARYHEEQAKLPRLLGEPQELDADGTRGSGSATMLRKDGGEAYHLKPRLLNQVQYAHYQLQLVDAQNEVVWTKHAPRPDGDDQEFQIVVPQALLRAGETYQLRISGLDGNTRELVGAYDLSVPAE